MQPAPRERFERGKSSGQCAREARLRADVYFYGCWGCGWRGWLMTVESCVTRELLLYFRRAFWEDAHDGIGWLVNACADENRYRGSS